MTLQSFNTVIENQTSYTVHHKFDDNPHIDESLDHNHLETN
jgi:hypothetical protein